MTRRTYIYCAIPLFTLLSCGASLVQMLGPMLALFIGLLLGTTAWGFVWARFYASRCYRPEFAILGVLPQLIFFALMYAGQTGAEGAFAAPMWQNIYFLLFLASMVVQILSLRPGSQDEPRRPSQDPPFIFLSVLIIANGFFSWVQYATVLFPIN